MSPETLGRFGHHPDPAIDFCVEVEVLEGIAYDRSVGFANPADGSFDERLSRAMEFRVGGDRGAIYAKHRLRELARREDKP